MTARISPGARAAAHRWVAFAAFVALAWQSFAVQTHVHRPTHLAGAGTATAAPATRHDRARHHLTARCALCAAATADLALPTPPPLPPAGTVALAAPRGITPPAAAVARSHAWRSRGPPVASRHA